MTIFWLLSSYLLETYVFENKHYFKISIFGMCLCNLLCRTKRQLKILSSSVYHKLYFTHTLENPIGKSQGKRWHICRLGFLISSLHHLVEWTMIRTLWDAVLCLYIVLFITRWMLYYLMIFKVIKRLKSALYKQFLQPPLQ